MFLNSVNDALNAPILCESSELSLTASSYLDFGIISRTVFNLARFSLAILNLVESDAICSDTLASSCLILLSSSSGSYSAGDTIATTSPLCTN